MWTFTQNANHEERVNYKSAFHQVPITAGWTEKWEVCLTLAVGTEPQIFWLWSLLPPIHLSQHPLNHNALDSPLVKAQCTHEFILSINFCRVFTLPSGPTLVCTARSFMTLKSVKTSSDRPATQSTRPIKQMTVHHDLATVNHPKTNRIKVQKHC